MTQKSIDLSTLQMLVKLVTPAPIAPVAPVVPSAFTKGSEDITGVAKDITFLRETVNEIKAKLEKMMDTHVTMIDFNDRVKADDVLFNDHENRIRSHTLTIEQLKTQLKVGWGAVVFAMGVLTVLSHFWR